MYVHFLVADAVCPGSVALKPLMLCISPTAFRTRNACDPSRPDDSFLGGILLPKWAFLFCLFTLFKPLGLTITPK
jgi:hypothetical protein